MINSFTALILTAAMVSATPALAQASENQGTAAAMVQTATPDRPLMRAATASAAQVRLGKASPRMLSALSGGQKILLGAGIGFAALAVPIAVMMNAHGHDVDGKLVIGAGMTGAMFSAAIAYKLIQ